MTVTSLAVEVAARKAIVLVNIMVSLSQVKCTRRTGLANDLPMPSCSLQ